jgi:hypothetical protein
MTKILVPIQFTGNVEVEVPNHLKLADKIEMARLIALARIVATTDNPDAPEEDAFDDYQEAGGKATGDEWDNAKTSHGGMWHAGPPHTEDAPTVRVSFCAQGHINQTIRITHPTLTPDQLIEGLNAGSIWTTAQEGGDVTALAPPSRIEKGDVSDRVGYVEDVDNNLEYDEFNED